MTIRHPRRPDRHDHLLTLRTLVILVIAVASGIAVRTAGGTLDVTIETMLAVALALHSLTGR